MDFGEAMRLMLRSAIVPAMAGYLFTYYNTKKADERKAQIERVNEQVRLLYGPLLACVHATRTAYAAMVRQHSPDGSTEGFRRAVRERPEGPEGEAYRRWMRTVLQPLNEKAADIIVNNVNMLEAARLDPILLQFVAHVSAYKVILRRWEEGAIQEWSAISYPNQLLEYVEREFRRIKRKQAELLGERQRGGASSGIDGGPGSSNLLEPTGPPHAKL